MSAPAAARRALLVSAVAACLLFGAFLRLTHARTWPPGPWVDEVYALRAARLAAAAHAPLSGTTALEPPDAGFVNAWVPNAYLAFVAWCDRGAHGGLRALRVMSIVPALALLAAGVLLAAVSARGRATALLAGALGIATSTWLLTTGRWGWDVVATSAILVLSAAAGTAAAGADERAATRAATPLALAGGALLGLAQYGSVAARLALAVPVLLLLLALARGLRREARLAGLALLAALAVALPLALHYARHPGRLSARVAELGVWRQPRPLPALAASVAAHARLFATGGDPNERHGSPGRPVLPAAAVALALAGAAAALRGERPALVSSAFAATLLAGGLLAYEPGGANAYRIAPAAPFLLVLAGVGAAALLDRVSARARAAATALLAVVLLATAALEVAGFVAWARAPRIAGAFGGPERALADALRAQRQAGEADVLLHPLRAARNPYVVDVLLGVPGDAAHAVGLANLAAPFPEWRERPSRDVLYADADDPRVAVRVEALGARLVDTGPDPLGRPGWALFRIPRDAALRSAEERLAQFPSAPALAAGNLVANADGLFSFASAGGLAATLDGRVLFDPALRPRGVATVRLARGAHALAVRRVDPRARLTVTAPDGFVQPIESAAGVD